jgi:hypothetical protein
MNCCRLLQPARRPIWRALTNSAVPSQRPNPIRKRTLLKAGSTSEKRHKQKKAACELQSVDKRYGDFRHPVLISRLCQLISAT